MVMIDFKLADIKRVSFEAICHRILKLFAFFVKKNEVFLCIPISQMFLHLQENE